MTYPQRFSFLLPVLLAGALVAFMPTRAHSQITLFAEDFEGLPLGPNVDEPVPFSNAFTHVQPTGWERFDDQVPGVGNPLLGVTEWEGWSFADIDFWQLAAQDVGPTPRDEFTLGQGTIAVADPDQWNDLGDPANSPDGGFFNTLLQTPFIDVSSAAPADTRLKLGFDSSWFGGDCCDDGRQFQPPDQPQPLSNNQTAIVRLRLENGETIELLRWEAAPFVDAVTDRPLPDNSPGAVPNPFYRPPETNERVWLDLEPQQQPIIAAALAAANNAGMGDVQIEFGMENAGDDGFWGIDNVEAFTVSTVPGDMNINGVLDTGDVEAFALGLLSVDEYLSTYYGEFPVTRGSPDGTFDFDDISWFVDVLDMGGVETSAAAIAAFFNPVPEPTSVVLLGCGAMLMVIRRRVA